VRAPWAKVTWKFQGSNNITPLEFPRTMALGAGFGAGFGAGGSVPADRCRRIGAGGSVPDGSRTVHHGPRFALIRFERHVDWRAAQGFTGSRVHYHAH